MKKRVKLLTTIASLCLAVALMAFGVYAASQANFAVTSQVSYSVGTNIAGTLTVTQYTADAKDATTTKGQEGSVTFGAEHAATEEALALEGSAPTLDNTVKYVTYVVTFADSTGTNDPTITISDIVAGGVALTGASAVTNHANWKLETSPTAAVDSVSFCISYSNGSVGFTNTEISFKINLNYAA